ncbi:unnamed protein product [Urochloa humidicola]
MAPSSRPRILLPEDAVYEILLRLPAKDLCRLCAVCRPWRSLLSSPSFAAAHAARHPEPLLLVAGGYASHRFMMNNGGDVLFDIMDLSGRIVRRFRPANEEGRLPEQMDENEMAVVSVQGDLVCLEKRSSRSCRLVNPATGAVRALPEQLAEEHATREHKAPYYSEFAFGQAAATGEYKVLRVHPKGLCEVFSLNGASHGRWRGRMAPPRNVRLYASSSVTIKGIVYFLSCEFVPVDFMVDTVAPFDLESEEWMPTIRGALTSLQEAEIAAGVHDDHTDWGEEFSLAVLDGCLVLAHHVVPSSLDLWFLMDADKALWVKQQSIQLEFNYWEYDQPVYPLLVLSDRRIVLIRTGYKGLLKIYDPRIGTCTDGAEIGHLYTGNLLSLAKPPQS